MRAGGATIIAHLNVQNRMSAPAGQPAPTPPEGWPSDTFVQGRRRKYHNGEAVEIWHRPNAATDGDSFVQFRRSDVIVTGDLFTTTQYPFIDVRNGGSVRRVDPGAQRHPRPHRVQGTGRRRER